MILQPARERRAELAVDVAKFLARFPFGLRPDASLMQAKVKVVGMLPPTIQAPMVFGVIAIGAKTGKRETNGRLFQRESRHGNNHGCPWVRNTAFLQHCHRLDCRHFWSSTKRYNSNRHQHKSVACCDLRRLKKSCSCFRFLTSWSALSRRMTRNAV